MASIILLGMPNARVCLPILFCLPLVAAEDVFLARVLERARQHISQLPDFVCAQTIERATRDPAQREFRVKDRLSTIVNCARWCRAGSFPPAAMRFSSST